jgi:hypothetical protein
MKLFIISTILLSATAFAHDNPPPGPDTLQVNTPLESTFYSGHISQYDDEDAIGQVEINGATITVLSQVTDNIFYNGFELETVNWIWIGDDTGGNEFGESGNCVATNWHNSDGSFHVELECN